MMRTGLLVLLAGGLLSAQDAPEPRELLGRGILDPSATMSEVQDRVEKRLLPAPAAESAAQWAPLAATMRAEVLEKIVYRGEAAAWRDLPPRVEWAGDLDGPGYVVRKLRYQSAPGLWIPALLYVPKKLTGKVPVHLAVSGHEKESKAVRYSQIRCLNLVKRGMIVLAADWFGFGQLRGPGYEHDRLNQLDLCGTSGLAPFYLTLKRGLDVLLSLDHADPDRAAVHGLSGGGWQTIWISALDPRVTLCNPVAGYSTLRTMTRHLKDLPDSEQAPSDLATVTDYAWFAALRAPRPTLLTYNRKDDCCYESGYALAPLVDAAQPIYRLFGKESNLRSHVHADPGNHNYGEDNRLALYRFVGDHFFPGDGAFDAKEIACDAEIKSVAELTVDLPKDNATFNSLARGLAADLPRKGGAGRAQLRAILRAKDDKVRTAGARTETGGGMKGVLRSFAMEGGITVPGVELSPAKPRSTTLLFSESGRKGLADEVARRLAAGERVLAVDPLGFGESKIAKHDVDFSLMLSAVGDRPLGIQASQLGAIARWAASEYKESSVTLAAIGPRASLAALAAAALEERAVGRVELSGCLKSLKDVLEQNLSYEKAPELFCFGLLEAFDVQPLMDLVAPRPVETLK